MDRLVEYALQFVGQPYRWGGDDTINGFDCSGFVQELLASVGMDPPGDQTADALYRYFLVNGKPDLTDEPLAGELVFFGKPERITHIGFCIDGFRMIEAGGGGSRTTSREAAARDNAYIRIRPINRRKDLIGRIMPDYPFLEDNNEISSNLFDRIVECIRFGFRG